MTTGYQQGFRSLRQEVEIEALPVTGTMPCWLTGTLLRNGPGAFEAGAQPLRHWFDGLAMLHRFSFHDGQVSYANRFLDTPDYRFAREHGRLGYSQFATDPCRSIFKRITSLFVPQFGHNASVNVSRLADRFIAWTETPYPVEFDPATLRAIGALDWCDDVRGITSTPHPHYDAATGDAYNNTVLFGARSFYNLYRIPCGHTSRRLIASLPVREPAYMHSFSMTPSYLVLAEYPYVVDPLEFVARDRPFAAHLRWRPERDAVFHVVARRDGHVVGRYRVAPFFSFHHVNAFEQDGAVIVDLLAYPDADVVRKLYLDVLRDPDGEIADAPPAQLRRYRIPLDGAGATYEILSDRSMELPRIDDRRNGRDYRYVYGVGLGHGRPYAFQHSLVKADVVTRGGTIWARDDCYPGEPVFVPAPGAQGEDDGVLLSVVLDGAKGTSFLLALDARTLEEIVRAEVPHHIPFGFHGDYFDVASG